VLENQDRLFSKVNNVAKAAARSEEGDKHRDEKINQIEGWIKSHPPTCPIEERKGNAMRSIALTAGLMTIILGAFKVLDIIAASQGWW